MLLKKIIPEKEIRKTLDEQKKAEEKFFDEFPKLFPSEDPQSELDETKKLNDLLKEEVFKRLLEHSKSIHAEKIEKQDLMMIIEYYMASMNPTDEIELKMKNYCNRCGKCCVVTSPIAISCEEYIRMGTIQPELIVDMEPNSSGSGFKFIEDQPCKFYDPTLKMCKIYNVRPSVCRNYPITDGGIVGAGDCEYIVRFIFEKSKNLLNQCLE